MSISPRLFTSAKAYITLGLMDGLRTYLLLGLALFAASARADMSVQDIVARVSKEHSDIPAEALQEATTYFQNNASSVTNKNFITIIDFDQPSTDYRMHVINMGSGEVISYLVAHGLNSGDLYALNFSNVDGSYMSSLGMYLTGEPYVGDNGLSMRLLGQEDSNSNAYMRDIVMHGAPYVSEDFIQQTGRLGRSEGCPAVEVQFATALVNQLDNGSVYLIYKKP